MIKHIVWTALIACLLSLQAFADPDASINGYWTSSSGSKINVCYAGNPDTFTIQVLKGNTVSANYEAHWMPGFRVQFYYFSGKDKIFAVYDPNKDQISLSNPDTNWSATWTR